MIRPIKFRSTQDRSMFCSARFHKKGLFKDFMSSNNSMIYTAVKFRSGKQSKLTVKQDRQVIYNNLTCEQRIIHNV